MAFVPQKLSVTATQIVRSSTIRCFSKVPLATTPFFRQWYIHTIDISKMMFISKSEARQVMQEMRSFFGKSKGDVISIDEFCAFTGIRKSCVRMHLTAQVIEHELSGKVTGW